MWLTPKEMGLTEEQTTVQLESLWKEAQASATRKCPDCGTDPNTTHDPNCDIARCSICGGQLISCDCKNGEPDIWTGIWPGHKECYEQRLIAYCDVFKYWCLDLNTLAVINARKSK